MRRFWQMCASPSRHWWQCPQLTCISALTKSPCLTARTSSPTRSTVPQNSCPTVTGALMRPSVISSEARNLSSFFGRFISPAPPPQSSQAPSNTPPPFQTAQAHIPTRLRRESLAHSAFHPQNSALHTHTLRRFPTIPHNSAASASRLPHLSHAPQNSHNQTPPADH